MLCATLTAHARAPVPTNITIGSVGLTLPAPGGHVNPAGAAPQLVEAMATMVPPQNRLLAAYLPPREIELYLTRNPFSMDRYSSVQTARSAEAMTVALPLFEEIKKSMKEQAAKDMQAIQSRTQSHLNGAADKLGKAHQASVKIKVDDLSSPGTFDETATSISMTGTGAVTGSTNGNVESKSVVYAMTVLLVKGKMLFLYTYSTNRSPADVQWVKQTSLTWAGDIQRAN